MTSGLNAYMFGPELLFKFLLLQSYDDYSHFSSKALKEIEFNKMVGFDEV